MGLASQSTGRGAMEHMLQIDRAAGKVVALAGNPNVGKSTVFNSLTGLKQHTGNWPGKTVSNAQGRYTHKGNNYILVDLPGTYSLMANSADEEAARDFICFGKPDAVVVVTDATCLERNMNLVLQTLEMTDRVVVCVNLLDEAERKKIRIDLKALSLRLGIPVIGASARNGKGLRELMDAVEAVSHAQKRPCPIRIAYSAAVEEAAALIEPVIKPLIGTWLSARWMALRLLEDDRTLLNAIELCLGIDLSADKTVIKAVENARTVLRDAGIGANGLRDSIVSSIVCGAEAICADTVQFDNPKYNETDCRIDKVLTSKAFGIPVMLMLLGVIFWITLAGANYPSSLLSSGLFWIQDRLTDLFAWAGAPSWLHGVVVLGMYRTLAWVIAVMLPPMAVFFPLFTFLEDLGYLPRIAFNLDKYFKRACACGKQALTMCMGFGCNAAGVAGCRIIESPRERLIATITNSFVPCNGRFPTLIAIISMFFAASAGAFQSLVSAFLLVGMILLGILMTLSVSKILSKTMLKGVPSSFTLELPPYRMPQVGKIIVRSLLDRTLFVLGRAVSVAAPAGVIIWCLANITAGEMSLLQHAAAFFDPFARAIGLDGFILTAFILGFPANEIVVPIVIMSYMATGSISELDSLEQLHALFVSHGWTWLTALCTMLFSLMHWPCGTTCWTIKKETGSWKWTAVSVIVPAVCGITVCFITAGIARLLGFA